MFALIRSCKYCANNGGCPVRKGLRDLFSPIHAEATAVVNCKKVTPLAEIGGNVSFFSWDGDGRVPDEEKSLCSGIVVGHIADRAGHVRTYAIKTDRIFAPYYESRDSQYWIDGRSAREQFPGVSLQDNEIIVFAKYTNVQTLTLSANEESE